MRAKNMILFVIAVGCGLVASVGVSQYMEHAANSGGVPSETAKIFVAVTDIGIGDKLDALNVKLEEWPKDRVPEGAITSLDDLEERFPRTRLYAGEPILGAKLMDSKDRGDASVTIPEGYRVVSVKVTVNTAVAGLIQPGNRVDLLLFLRKSAEVPETGTRTILKDVNVFGVDGETERTEGADGQARNVRTVSLLVTPKQSETVLLASEMGTLFLTLRRPDDPNENESDGTTVHSMLGTDAENANDKQEPNPADFADWLNQQADTPPEPVQVVVGDEGPAWTTIIRSPNGTREFQWGSDTDRLPREVTAPLAGPPAGPPELTPVNATRPAATAIEPNDDTGALRDRFQAETETEEQEEN